LGYRGWIYSFEPNPDAYNSLVEVSRKDALWRALPLALGSQDETKDFYLQAHSPLSSFLRPLNSSDIDATSAVGIRRLDGVLEELRLGEQSRILLKLDTQGWDLEVVKGAGRHLSRVQALLSEMSIQPLYENMTPYYKALEYYEGQGFVPYAISPINRAADGSIIECDCLMIRRAPKRNPN
jgi:FkbM family methyltransferase